MLSSQGVLQVNLCHYESKTIWKVSNNRFQIMILSCWLTLERSLNVKSSPTRLILLQCKSTQLTVPPHHEGKLCSTCLVAYYFFNWCILATFVFLQTSLSSFFSKDFQGELVLWYLPCVFTQEVASDSTQITVAAWIRGFPQIMIVENTESIESAITFTAHSTDSDNKVLSLEKENCTHGTLCSFPSVGIWVIEQLWPA